MQAWQLVEVAGRKRVHAGAEPIGKRAQGEQVGALVYSASARRLGSDEGWRAHQRAALAKRCERSEIDELELSVRCEPQVLRAQVAVHQLARVKNRDDTRDLSQACARFAPRHGCAVAEVFALEQLHGVERGVVRGRGVVEYAHDRGMLQTREGVIFALEELERVLPCIVAQLL